MESLYCYTDYRKYLKDIYEHKKRAHSYFSYRFFSQKIGLDASFLVKVIQKEKHITAKTVTALAHYLEFSDQESKYFSLLVSFTKAKKPIDIKSYYEKLIAFRHPHIKKIPGQKFEFFNQWYNLAIYEYIRATPFKGNFNSLARKILPKISPEEAKNSVTLLLDLKLINKQKDGVYSVVDDLITTGEKWESPAIHNFQKTVMQLGVHALDNIPKKSRDISTVTVSLSRNSFEAIKDRIHSLRQEILELSKADNQSDSVMQFNFEAFPLLNWKSGGLK